jgi:hypothetical protein
MASTFEVHKKGLAQLVRKRGGNVHAIEELVSNAQDENVRCIDIRFEHVGQRTYRLTVEDDSPDGFRDLSHSFTLFAPSYKKSDPTKRGRFNFGEKWVIAICDSAKISTTTGTVIFEGDERRRSRIKWKAGTLFEGYVTSTKEEYEKVCQKIRRIIPNEGMTITFNGEVLQCRKPVVSVEATLPTIIANEDGELVRTERKTMVNLYEVADGEEAHIYELDIPVVKTGDLYDYDVRQKVPLTLSRDNVPPSYLKLLRTLALDNTHGRISAEDVTAACVREAIDKASPEAVQSIIAKTFGDRRAIADPSDREAENRLKADGYTIIPANTFSKAAWANIKSSGAATAAGMIRPTPKLYGNDPNAPVRKLLDPKRITPALRLVEEYAVLIARRVVGCDLTVTWVNDLACKFVACYGPRCGQRQGALDFNVARLGYGWFERPPALTWEIESLLIHEFGHHASDNHLSDEYFDGLTEFGAKLSVLKLREPELFAKYR